MQARMTVYKRMKQLNELDKDDLINLVLNLEENLDIHKRYTNLCKSRMFHQKQVDKLIYNAPSRPPTPEKEDQDRSTVKLPTIQPKRLTNAYHHQENK